MSCDDCNMLSINGVACHETGCPSAWKDQPIRCMECGFDFERDSRFQTTCDDCIQSIESNKE